MAAKSLAAPSPPSVSLDTPASICWTYRTYGLLVRADACLQGLSTSVSDEAPDVVVHTHGLPADPASSERRTAYRSPSITDNGLPSVVVSVMEPGGAVHFQYFDGCQFLIERDAQTVWCGRPSGVSTEELAAYLRGPIFGMVLRLRGVVCLHASSVAIDAGAIAMVGTSGAGKSTTAAAFLQLGHRLIADDVTALRLENNHLAVVPGPPRVTLWPDAAAILFGSAHQARAATTEKEYIDVAASQQTTPLPLAGVYILDGRAAGPAVPQIEPISPSDAFLALTQDSYVNYALDETMRAREFHVLGELVRQVPVRRVLRNYEPSRVLDVCRAILRDQSRH